ncbi:MAG: hypothetical protein WDZ60_05440 [Wenzhouxiangellaceae bacterium]
MPEIDTAIISLVALVVATASMLISYRLFRLQNDPEVVVYATPDEKRPSVVVLIIENTGGSIARDVDFSFAVPIPGKAFGFEDAPAPEPMSAGPLVTGIPSFGPGAKRIITWGQYGGIHKGIGDSVLDITARYRGRRSLMFYRRRYKTVSRIDIKSFEHTDVSDHNWDKKMAESLKKIADAITPLRYPGKRLLEISIREKESSDEDGG